MGRVIIRQATLEDVSALEVLFRASYGELLKPDYPAPFIEKALPALSRVNFDLIDRGQFFLALTMEGDLSGAGGWSYEPPHGGNPEPGRAHIRHLAVSPTHMGRGVGRHIVDHCRDQAGEIDILECFSTLSALPFYRALGFEAVKEITVPLGPGLDFASIHMENHLNR